MSQIVKSFLTVSSLARKMIIKAYENRAD